MSYTTHVLRWLLIASFPMMGVTLIPPVHAQSLPEIIKSAASYDGNRCRCAVWPARLNKSGPRKAIHTPCLT
jgi:hypothetical protein